MKLFVYILGGIALAAFLMIAGCIGLAGLFVSSAVKASGEVDRQLLDTRYGAVVDHVKIELEKGSSLSQAPELIPAEVVAVLEPRAQRTGLDEYQDVLGRYRVEKTYHMLVNGYGVADVRLDREKKRVAVRGVEVEGEDYMVLIDDPELLKE